MPVQTRAARSGRFPRLAGTVTSGRVSVGDRIVDARSGLGATLQRIATMDGDLELRRARARPSTLAARHRYRHLARRGALGAPDSRPTVPTRSRRAWSGCRRRRSIRAPVICCARRPISRRSRRSSIKSLVDFETLAAQPAEPAASTTSPSPGSRSAAPSPSMPSPTSPVREHS